MPSFEFLSPFVLVLYQLMLQVNVEIKNCVIQAIPLQKPCSCTRCTSGASILIIGRQHFEYAYDAYAGLVIGHHCNKRINC